MHEYYTAYIHSSYEFNKPTEGEGEREREREYISGTM